MKNSNNNNIKQTTIYSNENFYPTSIPDIFVPLDVGKEWMANYVETLSNTQQDCFLVVLKKEGKINRGMRVSTYINEKKKLLGGIDLDVSSLSSTYLERVAAAFTYTRKG